jgi:cell division protein ZapA
MLLMAGLMLADRTAAYEERAREAEARLGEQERRIAELEAAARSDAASGGALPPEMVARLSGLVRRAEELAEDAEARRAM